ncbi:uncharacterized protein BCR38DRAFT_446666 [Pseudomassariella vexata]|uniref:Uncharacterized protein n=1 Tax=Pseudomassariella vexata TaxID=1141098 RepID=A0A1Y2DHV4_9PEZI|nr:uncharacterized protein BCR38DRAFT_446666 [Pseudomassariella vexata]ORY58810.1 hypothetical protein BCR38DRAFT_446666 [Pseudomassariella vexata]
MGRLIQKHQRHNIRSVKAPPRGGPAIAATPYVPPVMALDDISVLGQRILFLSDASVMNTSLLIIHCLFYSCETLIPRADPGHPRCSA